MRETVPYFKRIFPFHNYAFLIKVKIALHTFVSNYPVLVKFSKIFDQEQENLNNQDRLGLQTSCIMLVQGA